MAGYLLLHFVLSQLVFDYLICSNSDCTIFSHTLDKSSKLFCWKKLYIGILSHPHPMPSSVFALIHMQPKF